MFLLCMALLGFSGVNCGVAIRAPAGFGVRGILLDAGLRARAFSD